MCLGWEIDLSVWWLKCYNSQKNSLGTDRENIVPTNLCFMKANGRHRQKSLIKKYLPIQSMISSYSENS